MTLLITGNAQLFNNFRKLGIPFALVNFGAFDDLFVRLGFVHNQLFYEPMKYFSDVARASTVEAEDEFVEIPLEMLFLNGTLVGCAEPAPE